VSTTPEETWFKPHKDCCCPACTGDCDGCQHRASELAAVKAQNEDLGALLRRGVELFGGDDDRIKALESELASVKTELASTLEDVRAVVSSRDTWVEMAGEHENRADAVEQRERELMGALEALLSEYRFDGSACRQDLGALIEAHRKADGK